jgi:hypothetical protein
VYHYKFPIMNTIIVGRNRVTTFVAPSTEIPVYACTVCGETNGRAVACVRFDSIVCFTPKFSMWRVLVSSSHKNLQHTLEREREREKK